MKYTARARRKLLPGDVAGELDYIWEVSAVAGTGEQCPESDPHRTGKKACTKCDCIVEAPAPSRPIERGIAGPGLLARVLTGKYCEHLPLYRQSGNLCPPRVSN
ncbi:transposase [Escherichia coli]|uniref:IS66 family transposase n=1 Tax=Escherichia coli TaxID=562 RepID=UPI0039069A7E